LLHTPVHLIFDTPASSAGARTQHALSKHPHGIAQLPGGGLAPNTPYDVQGVLGARPPPGSCAMP